MDLALFGHYILEGQDSKKRLVKKVSYTLHSEFLLRKNCSIFGRKCQLAKRIKSDVVGLGHFEKTYLTIKKVESKDQVILFKNRVEKNKGWV